MRTILLNFYFFTAFVFVYIIFKIINNKFANVIYKKNLSLIFLSIILNLWLVYILSLIGSEYNSDRNFVFLLYNFIFLLFVIVVALFLNQYYTIGVTIVGIIYILIHNQVYGILILIPFLLILGLIIFQNAIAKTSKTLIWKNRAIFMFAMIGIPITLIMFMIIAITYYNVSYQRIDLLIVVVIFWSVTTLVSLLMLNFINKVFLNLDNIYNNSLFTTAGIFQSGIAPKIIKHFLQSEKVKLAYLFVLQYQDDHHYLQHHDHDKLDLSKNIKALIDIFKKELDPESKNKEVKFKIDEKHFALLLKVDTVSDLSNKYFSNFLINRSNDDVLLKYQQIIDRFNKKLKFNRFNCGVAIYGVHNYSINKLIDYAKFAIHFAQLKKLNNSVQIFNRANLLTFDIENSKIDNLKKLFNLYTYPNNMNLNKIDNSKAAILIYNMKNQYKFKSIFNKNINNDHLLADDFKRYCIYQKLKQLENNNKIGISTLLFEYPWQVFNSYSFNLNVMINNLLKTAPKIKKGFVFKINSDNYQNASLKRNIIILQNNNIETILDLTDIKNNKKIIKIAGFYSANAIIINKQDQLNINVKKIIKNKNKYYYN